MESVWKVGKYGNVMKQNKPNYFCINNLLSCLQIFKPLDKYVRQYVQLTVEQMQKKVYELCLQILVSDTLP